MKRVCALIAVSLLLALLMAACSRSKAPSPAENAAPTAKQAATAKPPAMGSTQSAASTDAVAPTQPPAQKATLVQKPAAAATLPVETISLESRDSGLDMLQSYRARWVGEWQAVEDGKPTTARWEWFEDYVADGSQHHWGSKMDDSQTQDDSSNIEFWRIGDTTYVASTDAQGQTECMAITGDPERSPLASGLMAPSRLGGINDAKYVGMETVNGISTRHYRYDDESANLIGFGTISGDIWVADDGGYVVKDQMSWQGGAGLFGVGSTAKGEGKWTFEVLDVNQPFNLEVPESCTSAGTVSLPLMPDATEKLRIGPMTTYKTASTLEQVVAFYKDNLAAAGWTLQGEPQVSETMGLLEFTRDGRRAQITAASADGQVQVMVSVSEE